MNDGVVQSLNQFFGLTWSANEWMLAGIALLIAFVASGSLADEPVTTAGVLRDVDDADEDDEDDDEEESSDIDEGVIDLTFVTPTHRPVCSSCKQAMASLLWLQTDEELIYLSPCCKLILKIENLD